MDYGGRGIKVCDEWDNDFMSFYNWCIENKWVQGLTLDRKDVDGDYCPENCNLITFREQSFNKRNTVYVTTLDGRSISFAKIIHFNNISHLYEKIKRRINKKETIEDLALEFNFKIPP